MLGKTRRPTITSHPPSERRANAVHPGQLVKNEYLDVLGVDVETFAERTGLERDRLRAILDGKASMDVDAAIRISRCLQLSADALMSMQVRADFSRARDVPEYGEIRVLDAVGAASFPESEMLRGRLNQSIDVAGERTLFFQEDVELQPNNPYAGLHAIFRGDRLRIYDLDATVLWIGPVLNDLSGRMHLPYIKSSSWTRWFVAGYRADLALGAEHLAFMHRVGKV